VMKNLLILLVLAHIGAVVVHQRIWKTGLLKRMMRAQD
jgi:cytochrome b561